MKTELKPYPNLETICRLCLKENAGTVSIFSNEESGEKYTALSIPTRIMTCSALEVQRSDAFPKKICSDCRLQLEKTYYFRKLSQASDAKLRKHLRLISTGKPSKVFDPKLEEDEDESEFQDSLIFIKEQEEKQKQSEKLRIDAFMVEMKLQNERDLQKIRANLKEACRQELIPEIRSELQKELQVEVKNQLEENIRKEVTEQCIRQAKESLRSEVREECRKLEMKCLLDDLQTYLTNKSQSLNSSESTNAPPTKRKCSATETIEPVLKIKCVEQNSPKIEIVHMEVQAEDHSDEKKGETSAEDMNENDQHANEEECDSEGNFFIYDTEEGFDIQKKPIEDKSEYDENVVHEVEFEDEFIDSSFVTYEKVNEDLIDVNEDSGENTSTTSYQIEDNEDGEIKFLKKSNDDINKTNDVETSGQKDEFKNIMVINVNDGVKHEYVQYFRDEEQKNLKPNKKSSPKNRKSPRSSTENSLVTRTKSVISEATVLTKTYVNPLQRSTDTPKIFKCNDCPMVFSTKPSLERHLRTHLKVEKTGITYQCPECRIVVSCSSALRRHMYVHCEEKPFACNLCDKAFVQKEILKRHMQTHTGIKPHPCPHCERSFAQRINLTQHINRTHLKEPRIQQHSCYLCPKRFNHASGLSRHLVSHSGVAFQCSECDRTFGDRSSIRRHISNMHGAVSSSKVNDKTENIKTS